MALTSGEYETDDDRVELSDSCRKYLNLYKRVQDEKKIAKSSVDKKVCLCYFKFTRIFLSLLSPFLFVIVFLLLSIEIGEILLIMIFIY